MAEPITVVEAAEFLRLDTSTSPVPEQALLTSIISAARLAAEAFTNRTITERERVEMFDGFATVLELPYGDVSAITEIAYIDTNGDSQTVDTWVLNKNRLTAAYGESWPATRVELGAVTVTYTSGYADGSVPEAIVQAMYLMIGGMYDVRDEVSQGNAYQTNPTVERLLMPYRIDLGV